MNYERLRDGERGMLPERELEPIDELPDFEDLRDEPATAGDVLDQAVVPKLNGGLGTSMGLMRAKSLLEVKDGLTFLDIIARQVLELRRRSQTRLPLVLMNSFATHDDSLAALERYPEIAADVPLAFIQNKFPRLRADDLHPVQWPDNPALEWAPPGHGDLYTAIAASGMLAALLERGYRYAFVSNSDNLGATLEPRILAWLAREGIPFLMEVADRTPADRKGGHLARLRGDGLVLRESAQTPPEDLDAFQDVRRHRFFNTNNLWVDLSALAEELERRAGVLELPLIVNRKTVDPADPSSPPQRGEQPPVVELDSRFCKIARLRASVSCGTALAGGVRAVVCRRRRRVRARGGQSRLGRDQARRPGTAAARGRRGARGMRL